MAAISVVGSMGSTEIHRDVFLSSTAPAEWKAHPAYASAHFVELPIAGGGGGGSSSEGLVMCMPREIKHYRRPDFGEGGGLSNSSSEATGETIEQLFQVERT